MWYIKWPKHLTFSFTDISMRLRSEWTQRTWRILWLQYSWIMYQMQQTPKPWSIWLRCIEMETNSTGIKLWRMHLLFAFKIKAKINIFIIHLFHFNLFIIFTLKLWVLIFIHFIYRTKSIKYYLLFFSTFFHVF